MEEVQTSIAMRRHLTGSEAWLATYLDRTDWLTQSFLVTLAFISDRGAGVDSDIVLSIDSGLHLGSLDESD